MAHRVLTVSTINEALAQGKTEFALEPGDIVTPLAKEHAQQLGLRLIPCGGKPGGAAPQAAEVRKAVIAALGREPEGLDAIIARVLK